MSNRSAAAARVRGATLATLSYSLNWKLKLDELKLDELKLDTHNFALNPKLAAGYGRYLRLKSKRWRIQ